MIPEPVILGPCTLYNADCLEVLPTLKGVDCVVTDPPYGMNNNADSNRFSSVGVDRLPCRAHDSIIGDDSPFDPVPWLEYSQDNDCGLAMWGANHYAQRLPIGTTMVWLKRHPELYGSFLSDAEIGWMRGGCGVYCYYKQFPPPVRAVETGGDPCRPTTPHPNLKPIGLQSWCLDLVKAQEGATVLDPYMGSGTTGIACIRTGRKFIGIELDPGYFKIACDRICRELQQTTLSL